jgi:NTE family protein
VAGSSAGAIAATLSSFRLSAKETLALFNSLDLAKVPQTGSGHSGVRSLPPFKNAENIRRLVEKFGWHSSAYFHEWMGEVIASCCEGNASATFADFEAHGFRDLYIVASNLSRKQAEIFSYNTTPQTAVADAVRLSMSIPLYFEAVRFDGKEFGKGDYYLDGGLYSNYPIHLFDQPRFAQGNRFYKNGINWETLGLFLKSDDMETHGKSISPENLFDFITLTIRSFYDSHALSNLDKNIVDRKRSIIIDDCGVSPLQFDLECDSDPYKNLFTTGRESVERFLADRKNR